MLAKILQSLVLACALLIAVVVWRAADTPLAAAAGIVAGLAALFWLTLSLTFGLSGVVNRRDPAPFAGLHDVFLAIVSEAIAAVRVFLWWQPFRHAQIADGPCAMESPLRGVIFLHGFFCNRGIWTLWMRELQQEGRPFIALNFEPVFGTIDGYEPQVERAVERLTRLTGQAPVLVCHSMGGLVARAWLRRSVSGGAARVSRVITIGSPHHGTWMGYASPVKNGREMRRGSIWLSRLAADHDNGVFSRFVCWFSNCDNIVFPASTATLPGADNRFAPGVGHVQMALDAHIRRETLALIRSL